MVSGGEARGAVSGAEGGHSLQACVRTDPCAWCWWKISWRCCLAEEGDKRFFVEQLCFQNRVFKIKFKDGKANIKRQMA